MTSKTSKIVFDDGRKGRQTVLVHDNGDEELTEVVVTQTASGEPCRHVYSARSDIQARVYSFSDLGNVEWTLASTKED